MPDPKRIIPVSEVKPGDSIRMPGSHVTLFVRDAFSGETDRYVLLDGVDQAGDLFAFHAVPATDTCTVGYTNRKAKRARGKMARRQRFADRDAASAEAAKREDTRRYWADEHHRLQMKSSQAMSDAS